MKKAFTLVEMMVVITIMLILSALAMPPVSVTIRSFRESAAKTCVKSSIATGQSWAAARGKYAGVRFSINEKGRQFVTMIELGDLTWSSIPMPHTPDGDYYYKPKPVENHKSLPLPLGQRVLAGWVADDTHIDTQAKLDFASNFTVIFSSDGTLKIKPVLVDGIPQYSLANFYQYGKHTLKDVPVETRYTSYFQTSKLHLINVYTGGIIQD